MLTATESVKASPSDIMEFFDFKAIHPAAHVLLFSVICLFFVIVCFPIFPPHRRNIWLPNRYPMPSGPKGGLFFRSLRDWLRARNGGTGALVEWVRTSSQHDSKVH